MREPRPGSRLSAVGTTIRDEAICIRHWDWSETSQTVSLFSCEHGVIRGIAKGAKREKAPFSGGLELLTRGEVVAIVRSNGSLATITSWDLRDAYTGVRRSLRAFYVGSYLVDLLHHAVTDADPHPGLYHRMVEVFETLADRTEESLLGGQWAVLAETGYTPALPRERVEPGTAVCFLPREGVFLAGDASRARPDGWRVRPETLAWLARFSDEGRVSEGDDASVSRANRLLGSYLRYVLGDELPTMRPVFGESGLVS